MISKPVGLLSQGNDSQLSNVVDWLRARWKRPFVGLVHRLDRNTSGLMVVGQRSKSASRLTASLQEGTLRRSYLAWVTGSPPPAGSWTHWLTKNSNTNKVTVERKPSSPAAQIAKLQFKSIQTISSDFGILTLVQFTLDTGRSHQIRAQAAFEGFSLLGDTKYGGPNYLRLGLHSFQIEFPYPVGSPRRLSFQDPLPQELDPGFLTKR